ncbi:MAG: hypothetical protein COU28_01865 [Candidatus Magasanikbacteria bacterium CG10_big_fil_rev_8_21_14_0_10_36_16]|uniref:Uncharacterized protein n=1 Tax=Candidatus Magasanikbacteria bacterium CG10_big_fil_rev_8_21_14_0_10_36_16 TaxID=1974645 RepID=A0A2H0TYS1_9BACT|nr:MAG: hypothetical protein COU28_01865 [Candidatus Magasanikbacteria bacterium CG10_big_fil_rev_8_21_14_0_10_36_16]
MSDQEMVTGPREYSFDNIRIFYKDHFDSKRMRHVLEYLGDSEDNIFENLIDDGATDDLSESIIKFIENSASNPRDMPCLLIELSTPEEIDFWKSTYDINIDLLKQQKLLAIQDKDSNEYKLILKDLEDSIVDQVSVVNKTAILSNLLSKK